MIELIKGNRVSKRDMKRWIDALRSGEYKQTKGVLNDSRGYCCLGVACDLFITKDNIELTKTGHIKGIDPIIQTFCPEWLKYVNSDFAEKNGKHLSWLNDVHSMTFKAIADELEKTYLGETL